MHQFLRAVFSLFVASFILSGCSTQGIAEFGLYTEAFNKQYEQSEMILDAVAAAERTIALRTKNKSAFPTFNPDDAAYYIEGVDPPLTSAIRGSVHTLKQYNDVLTALANGEAAAAFSAKVGTLASNVTAAVTATAGVVDPPGVVGAAALATSINGKLVPLQGILTEFATIASRDAFRRQLLATYPTMDALLDELRAGTPVMFNVFQRSLIKPGSVVSATGLSPEGEATLEKDRQLLSTWVLMIDQTKLAMKAAVEALLNKSSDADLAALNDAAVELRMLADKARVLRAKQ